MATVLGGVPVPQPRPARFEERFDALPQHYPNAEDLAVSKQYDTAYGDPNAGYFNPKGAVINRMRMEFVPHAYSSDKVFEALAGHTGAAPIGQDIADTLRQGWLASQKSGVAALGYDPHHTMVSPNNGGDGLNVAGFYGPKPDLLWFDQERYPNALTHESMHRGIEQLRRADALPDPLKKVGEETLVRALMLKHYGDTEYRPDAKAGNKQVENARPYVNDPRLDLIEKAASDLYHKQQRPMGPR